MSVRLSPEAAEWARHQYAILFAAFSGLSAYGSVDLKNPCASRSISGESLCVDR
jgi:hypothetical protein